MCSGSGTGERHQHQQEMKEVSNQHRNIVLKPILTSPVAGSHSYRAARDITKTRVTQEKGY